MQHTQTSEKKLHGRHEKENILSTPVQRNAFASNEYLVSMTMLRMTTMMILIRMMIQFVSSEMCFENCSMNETDVLCRGKNALIRKMKENSFPPQQNLSFKENGTKHEMVVCFPNLSENLSFE